MAGAQPELREAQTVFGPQSLSVHGAPFLEEPANSWSVWGVRWVLCPRVGVMTARGTHGKTGRRGVLPARASVRIKREGSDLGTQHKFALFLFLRFSSSFGCRKDLQNFYLHLVLVWKK